MVAYIAIVALVTVTFGIGWGIAAALLMLFI